MMRAKRLSDSGMTLLELLVVIAVFGIFMGIAIPSVVKSFASMDRVKKSTARYSEARRALGAVCDMLRQTYTGGGAGAQFVGRNGSYEAGGVMLPSDDLSFPILNSRYARVGSLQKVKYQLELTSSPNDEPRGLIQTRSAVEAPPEAGVRESLLPQAMALDFRYLDDSQKPAVWAQEWPPYKNATVETEPDGLSNPAPAAVEVTIYLFGPGSSTTPFRAVVNLPATRAS